jgi:8-oxo-dGTP diphosphatase
MRESLVIANIYGLVRPHRDDSKILLQERWKPDTDPLNSGKLELPGGKWQAFESAHDCLRREVQEETSVVVNFVDQPLISHQIRADVLVETSQPIMISQMVAGPYPSVLLVYSCEGIGEPKEGGDGSRYPRWWPLSEVKKLIESDLERFTPLTFAVLKHYFAIHSERK